MIRFRFAGWLSRESGIGLSSLDSNAVEEGLSVRMIVSDMISNAFLAVTNGFIILFQTQRTKEQMERVRNCKNINRIKYIYIRKWIVKSTSIRRRFAMDFDECPKDGTNRWLLSYVTFPRTQRKESTPMKMATCSFR